MGVAVKDLARAQHVIGKFNVKLFQSPVWQPPRRSFPMSLNYAQNLFRNGYWHLPSLKANLKAWLHLLETFQADFILADHAPTAILAAKLMRLPRGALGAGLALPPFVSPMPSLHPWLAIPKKLLLEKEKECTHQINWVLAELDAESIECLADIFDGTEIFLTTCPELDHYANRPKADYRGPILSAATEHEPEWPCVKSDKIFIYINYRYRFFSAIMDAVKKKGMPALAVIPDIPETERKVWESKTLAISSGPVNFKTAARECSFAVTHGGFNTANLALLSEKPLLILPEQLEQALLAYRITGQGLGMMVNWFNPRPNISQKLDALIRSETLLVNARAFVKKYPNYDSAGTVNRICRRISSLL
ncbi:MAG: glycosyltransferase [Desulfobacterales bacterium]